MSNIIYVKKNIWNPATFNCENGKDLASIMDDSVIICNKVIEAAIKKQFL